MQPLILHIPHASLNIPFNEGYKIGDELLKAEMLKLTDWHTDDLFYSATDIMIKAPFSRVFCDVERFANDKDEPMSKLGMGALYEQTDTGLLMRELNASMRERILKEYYWPHHHLLADAVQVQLANYSKATIVDCHSFTNLPFIRDQNQAPNRPDFNIGTDSYHTPKGLVEFSSGFFKDKGFTVEIDWPYNGSMVPSGYYQSDKRVQSIMLEVNRSLYLREGTNEKSKGYDKIKGVLKEYLEEIKKYI